MSRTPGRPIRATRRLLFYGLSLLIVAGAYLVLTFGVTDRSLTPPKGFGSIRATRLVSAEYFLLLNHVAALSTETIIQQAKTDFNYWQIATEPEPHKGQFLTVSGLLLSLRRLPRLAPQGDAVIPVYEAVLYNPGRGEKFYLDFQDDPKGFEPYQPVTFSGAFLKIHLEDNDKGLPIAAPMLVGHQLEQTPPAEPHTTYYDLLLFPEEHRHEPITATGRLEQWHPVESATAIRPWQALFVGPHDTPYIVYLKKKPERVAIGDWVVAKGMTHGTESFVTPNQITLHAPVLIARTFQPSAPADRQETGQTLLTLAIVVSLVILYLFTRRRRAI